MRRATLLNLLILAAALTPRGAPAQTVPKELSMQPTKPPIPEMVGATSAPFELGKGVTTISFELHPPAGPAADPSRGRARRFLLRLENVKSSTIAPPFDIYLNVPQGSSPDRFPQLFAFTMSTFGLVESSAARGHRPGNGLNLLEDVTDLQARLLSLENWDERKLQVSFVPAPWKDPIKVQVGRASLMIE
jgi:tyrosinase